MENYYEILKIDILASTKQVKSAFYKLAHDFHPDKHSTKKLKEHDLQKFRKIIEAYKMLSNEENRLQYDLKLLKHYKNLAKLKGYKLKNERLRIFDTFYWIALSTILKKA